MIGVINEITVLLAWVAVRSEGAVNKESYLLRFVFLYGIQLPMSISPFISMPTKPLQDPSDWIAPHCPSGGCVKS